MRIPWYIYTPLSLLVIALTLYLSIKDDDFVTPPSPEATAEAIKKWRADNPSIKDTKLSDNDKPSAETETQPEAVEPEPTPPTPPEPEPEPEPVPVVKIPFTSPALNAFTNLDLSSRQFIAYADQKLKEDSPQLARFAYERVIDFAKDASEDDRKLAAAAIAKLITKTPLWNPDPSTRKSISINITINEQYQSSAEALITLLEELVFDASGGMLNPSVKLSSSSAPLSSLSIGNNSSPVRFSVKDNQELNAKIFSACYNAIRNKNNKSQDLISTPALPTHISPKQALETYITRLAWVNAAN